MQTQAARFHLDAGAKMDTHTKGNAKLIDLVSETSSQMHELVSRFEAISANLGSTIPRTSNISVSSAKSSRCRSGVGRHTRPGLVEIFSCHDDKPISLTHVSEKPQADMSLLAQESNSNTVAFMVHKHLNKDSLCPCKCHVGAHLRTYGISAKLFGSIFACYSGVPFLNGPCDVDTCSQNCGKSFDLMYTFPLWFVHWVLYTHISVSARGEPSFGITFMRRTQITEYSIFAIARRGEYQKLRQILEGQSALSGDIEVKSGRNALFWAIHSESTETISALLHYGTNPLTIDDSGISPSTYTYYLSLTGYLDTKFLSELERLFLKSTSESEFEFSRLHKVVCGILNLDLQEELRMTQSRLQLEDRDRMGSTALYWASTRGDEDSVAALLLVGANPNARNLSQSTPLIASGRASTNRCLELLLQAKADPNATNHHGFSALHCVCRFKDDPIYIVPLLIAGANINCVTKRNFTPLMVSVFERRPKMCEFLLRKGADMDISSLYGHPPLFEAIRRQSHACLRLLLEAGASYTVIAEDKSTILHHTAQHGNFETLEILIEAKLGNMDTLAMDSRGRQAKDIAAAREESMPGFRLAFSFLEDAVSNDDDIFYDTLENYEKCDDNS